MWLLVFFSHLCHFVTVPWVGLQRVIVAFPGESLVHVPTRDIFCTNISHFVKYTQTVKFHISYKRLPHIDKTSPKSAAFCIRFQFFTALSFHPSFLGNHCTFYTYMYVAICTLLVLYILEAYVITLPSRTSDTLLLQNIFPLTCL